MRRWLAIGVAGAVLVGTVVMLWPDRAEAVLIQGTFVDDNGSPHENGIEAMALAQITSGCNPPGNTRFCPNDSVTRAEAATFLARALGLPSTNQDFFVDDKGHVLEGGINKVAAAGLTVGCNPPTNNRFCPERSLTRAEFATFITRALDLPQTNQDFFVDDNGHVLEGPINRIAEAGITVGCNPPTNNRFCPNRVLHPRRDRDAPHPCPRSPAQSATNPFGQLVSGDLQQGRDLLFGADRHLRRPDPPHP